MPTGESPTGLNVTLDTEHAEKLSQMAERSRVREATLAGFLLARAIDQADIDSRTMSEVLTGIRGALDRAQLGREQGRRGEAKPLEDA